MGYLQDIPTCSAHPHSLLLSELISIKLVSALDERTYTYTGTGLWKLLFIFPVHFLEDGSLPVNDLVVGQGQQEGVAVKIVHGEGHQDNPWYGTEGSNEQYLKVSFIQPMSHL
ncbi:MAG: hypothetical protein ACLTLQ_08970 [[Clostridium] scindens]